MGRYRMPRVERLMREKIGALILEGAIKDPRVDSFLSVTRVEVAGDFSWADVFVSGRSTAAALDKAVAGLSSAAGFIQRALASSLRTRVTPRLRFHADHAMRDAFALNQKIDRLARENSPPDAPENAAARE